LGGLGKGEVARVREIRRGGGGLQKGTSGAEGGDAEGEEIEQRIGLSGGEKPKKNVPWSGTRDPA